MPQSPDVPCAEAPHTTEGRRWLIADPQRAWAWYEVAPLADSRWALAFQCWQFVVEDGGVYRKWLLLETRAACVQLFRQTATEFFSRRLRHGARKKVLASRRAL